MRVRSQIIIPFIIPDSDKKLNHNTYRGVVIPGLDPESDLLPDPVKSGIITPLNLTLTFTFEALLPTAS